MIVEFSDYSMLIFSVCLPDPFMNGAFLTLTLTSQSRKVFAETLSVCTGISANEIQYIPVSDSFLINTQRLTWKCEWELCPFKIRRY